MFTAPSKFWAELVNVPFALLTISVAVILPEPVFVNFPSLVKVVDLRLPVFDNTISPVVVLFISFAVTVALLEVTFSKLTVLVATDAVIAFVFAPPFNVKMPLFIMELSVSCKSSALAVIAPLFVIFPVKIAPEAFSNAFPVLFISFAVIFLLF